MAESVSEKPKEVVETSSEKKDVVEIKEDKHSSEETNEKKTPDDDKTVNKEAKTKTNEEKKSETNEAAKTVSENQKGKEIVIKSKEQTVDNFIEELLKEKDTIDMVKCPKIRKLIDDKIYDLKNRGKNLNIHNMMKGSSRIVERVYIPSIGKKKSNFLIPKLIGYRGQNLKRFERETKTRINIKGKGSKIDKKSEIELKNLIDTKYDHLCEELHLEIISEALPDEAHLRISNAIKQLKSFILNEENSLNGVNNAPQVWNTMQDAVQIIIPQTFDNFQNFSQPGPSFTTQQHFASPSMIMQRPSQNYIIPGVGVTNGAGNHFGTRTNLANGSSPSVFRNNNRSRQSPYNRPAPVRRIIDLDYKK